MGPGRRGHPLLSLTWMQRCEQIFLTRPSLTCHRLLDRIRSHPAALRPPHLPQEKVFPTIRISLLKDHHRLKPRRTISCNTIHLGRGTPCHILPLYEGLTVSGCRPSSHPTRVPQQSIDLGGLDRGQRHLPDVLFKFDRRVRFSLRYLRLENQDRPTTLEEMRGEASRCRLGLSQVRAL